MYVAWSRAARASPKRSAGVRLMFSGAAALPAAVIEQFRRSTGKPI